MWLLMATSSLPLANDSGYPELIRGAAITPDLFRVLLVSLSLGRSFTADENQSWGTSCCSDKRPSVAATIRI
jgi:hypothetical protein